MDAAQIESKAAEPVPVLQLISDAAVSADKDAPDPKSGKANFASVDANVHNHFNLERHLVDLQTYKQRRSAALAAWQVLAN